uniref:Uncharacterized protein n=1 Tax=Anguilla anguilla TaxID=7936 RepID=A0A0E9VIE1_ANGAN
MRSPRFSVAPHPEAERLPLTQLRPQLRVLPRPRGTACH